MFKITMEVCTAIVQHLMPIVIKFPNDDEVTDLALSFFAQSGMPNCVGAIDGCQICITQPQSNGEDYWNHNNFFSINLQAVVDYSGR